MVLIIFFSGVDCGGFKPPGNYGTAKDGAEYYDVKTMPKDTKIDGCYQKIDFHSKHPDAKGHRYPIYKQTGGTFYLKINEEKSGAPWLFADETKNIKYE